MIPDLGLIALILAFILALFGAGLLGLGMLGRRRRRA